MFILPPGPPFNLKLTLQLQQIQTKTTQVQKKKTSMRTRCLNFINKGAGEANSSILSQGKEHAIMDLLRAQNNQSH
jgi:hypothetical protein